MAISALASAICLVSVAFVVSSASFSACSLVMISAFLRAAARSKFSCTVPKCANWFTTPLQIPDVGLVVAPAGAANTSMPANIPGRTTAPARRRAKTGPAAALRTESSCGGGSGSGCSPVRRSLCRRSRVSGMTQGVGVALAFANAA